MKKNTKGVGKVIKAWAIYMPSNRRLKVIIGQGSPAPYAIFPAHEIAEAVVQYNPSNSDICLVEIRILPPKTKKKH